MKLDIDVPNVLNNSAMVFLDGVEQQYVTVADEEGGYIKRYVTNEKGAVRKHIDFCVQETFYGKVEIKFPKEESI